MPQAIVNIWATEPLHQTRCQVQLFYRAVRTNESAKTCRTKLCADLLEPVRHILQSSLPIYRLPSAALLDHRTGQSLVAAQGFIRKAITIRQPAFIDLFIFQRDNAHDLVVFNLNNQVRAG